MSDRLGERSTAPRESTQSAYSKWLLAMSLGAPKAQVGTAFWQMGTG